MGRGEGEDQNSTVCPHLHAPPKCGLTPTPARRPAFQGGEEKGLRAERGERGLTAGDLCSAQCALSEEGHLGHSAQGPRPPSYSRSALFERPRWAWASSFAAPARRWGEAAPGLGLWVLTDYSCPVSQCLGQPRGPLGHPQPAPRESGHPRFWEPPARQGALNRGSGGIGLPSPGTLGKSRPLPGPRCPHLRMGWGLE